MQTISFPQVEGKIIIIRNQQVMLDCDVAEHYGVATMRINEAVKNNPEKFPDGFVFELEKQEFENLRTKFSIAKFSKTRFFRNQQVMLVRVKFRVA
jgi:hypothetical protein